MVPIATPKLEWQQDIGDYALLAEWIGYLEIAIDHHGWRQVVKVWVPRLSPGLSTKLFHGVIHVAHAVRALTVADTSARRTELARALAYWAARYRRGRPLTESAESANGDLRTEVVATAETAARLYLAAPSILHLHGVTGAMALELLLDHIPYGAGRTALAQVRAEHSALYQGVHPLEEVCADEVSPVELPQAAAQSGDVHQVKLVEACRRAFEISGSAVFIAAAQTVTGLGRVVEA